MFYKPVGITTEIRAGYLVKSPPMKRFKTEVTELASWVQHVLSCLCVVHCMLTPNHVSPAEVMEEALLCVVQSH